MIFLEIDPNRPLDFQAASERAVRAFNRGVDRIGMISADSRKVRRDSMDMAYADLDRAFVGHANKLRADAASVTQGLWQPNDLTVRAKEIFAEPEPDMVMSSFPIQSEGQVGMNDMELLREFYGGRASLYAAGNGKTAGTASVGRSALRVPILCLLIRVQMDFLDKARERATGRDIMGAKMTAAKRALSQAMNELFLNGDAATGCPGLLANNPYIPALLSATSISSASTAATIIQAIGSLIDNVRIDSRGAYKPDTVFMAGGIMDYLSRTLVDTGSGRSIMDFLEEQYKRKGIEFKLLDALNSRGPTAASEPILVTRIKDRVGASVKLEVTMQPTPIASVSDGLLDEVYVAACVGGAHPRFPSANAVGNFDT